MVRVRGWWCADGRTPRLDQDHMSALLDAREAYGEHAATAAR
ncbi:hypothetical protein N5079_15975 [Planotetraspora sp. A-T 1434]|nr:hypothetical protein [Planotetraspora sp. A-T 1434]MCT9931711.1 hypothetical protein [Planotetraspora sp. A-T 1434]